MDASSSPLDLGPDLNPDHPLRSLPIEVTITVGRARPRVAELLALGENAVLPLDRRVDDPVELWIGDRLIARGELMEIEGGEGGQLGVRLTEVARAPRANLGLGAGLGLGHGLGSGLGG